MIEENDNDLEGTVIANNLDVRYRSDRILEFFEKIILEMNGDIKNPSINRFKNIFRAYTDGFIQHLKIISTVFKISDMFSTAVSLDDVLAKIVETIKIELKFIRVIILLLNEDKTLLECKIIKGMNKQQKLNALTASINMKKHDCIETKVVKTGKAHLINEPNDNILTYIDKKIIKKWDRQRTIYAPIISKSGIIGALGVDSPLSMPPLDSSDVNRVQLFANHIGLLIENAKLYESIISHKNLFERIVEHSPSGIILLQQEEIKHINPSGKKILGLSNAEILNRPVEYILGKQLTKKIQYAASQLEQIEPFELNLKYKDKRSIILNMSIVKLKIFDNVEQIIIFQDITKKKTVEKHIERLDKLATIGTISAGIAHEIRSPLTSITMDLDSMYSYTKNEVKVRKTIAQTLNEIERIDRIISNLLRFSRLSNEGFIHADLITILKESQLLAERKSLNKDIKFITVLPESMITYLNPDMLRQVMINLLINSIESISDKGKIIIKAEFIDKENEIIDMVLNTKSSNNIKNFYKITVQDNGPGIPAEIIDNIFDPYFTTKTTGVGLGLSISSKFVNEHGGILNVQSEPGRETIFEVILPNKIVG